MGLTLSSSCCPSSRQDAPAAEQTWKERLEALMPYLGHRNWIVITDKAYPLQTSSGIITLYADEPYEQVLETVHGMIRKQDHVFAHVWLDEELSVITENEVKGIDALRDDMRRILGPQAESLPHESLISRLDEAGKLYQVVLVKTPSLVPYTTTFFELDCGYWDSARQSLIDERMRNR